MRLRGTAKAAFLAKMAAGRARARRGAARARKPKRVQRRGARSRKRLPNPQLMTISNPAVRGDMARAVAAYTRFHGIKPVRAMRLGKGKGVLVALGELREIVYQPRRGARRGPAFFHAFKAGNVLAVTADGRKLVIVDRARRRAVDFTRGIVS